MISASPALCLRSAYQGGRSVGVCPWPWALAGAVWRATTTQQPTPEKFSYIARRRGPNYPQGTPVREDPKQGALPLAAGIVNARPHGELDAWRCVVSVTATALPLARPGVSASLMDVWGDRGNRGNLQQRRGFQRFPLGWLRGN